MCLVQDCMGDIGCVAPLWQHCGCGSRHVRTLSDATDDCGCRMFEGMQLDDWTQLSGLTGLTLRRTKNSHNGTLIAVLPQLTTLQSLVLPQLTRLHSLVLAEDGSPGPWDAGWHADSTEGAGYQGWT
jgi:hypothetical protein